MSRCIKCGAPAGAEYLCSKCLEETKQAMEARRRKIFYAFISLTILLVLIIYAQMPPDMVSQILEGVSSGLQTIMSYGPIAKVKEIASGMGVQIYLILAIGVFVLIGSIAMLLIAKKGS